jgi:hypothetical protein
VLPSPEPVPVVTRASRAALGDAFAPRGDLDRAAVSRTRPCRNRNLAGDWFPNPTFSREFVMSEETQVVELEPELQAIVTSWMV